jgi:diguanylate cyclase
VKSSREMNNTEVLVDTTTPNRAVDRIRGPGNALALLRHELRAARREVAAFREREYVLERQVALLSLLLANTQRSALRDELTGLPNRRVLVDRFNHAVARAARQHELVGLLFLDVDGFKKINDTLGHAFGDRLLQQVALRLKVCLRASDTACRYGGDEFIVLLPELCGRKDVVGAAHRIRTSLEPGYIIDGTSIEVTTSMGMAIYPVDADSLGDLLQASDLAMYRNKVRSRATAHPQIQRVTSIQTT